MFKPHQIKKKKTFGNQKHCGPIVLPSSISQEQVIYKFLATRIYKFIGWGDGGRHFKEVSLVNLGVSSGELSFSKSYMISDKRGHHGIGIAMLMN